MHYIVLDFEFNQAFSFRADQPAQTDPNMPCEIIQIGAVKLDESLQEVGRYNALVRPKLYPKMHPKVQKLTGLSRELLQQQPFFPAVYEDFVSFIGPEPAVLCSWGVDDIKSLFRNIYFHQLDDGLITKNYLNLQAIAGNALQPEAHGQSMGLQKAVELLELPQEERFHDALNDAYYTALVFQKTAVFPLSASLFHPADLGPKKEPLTRPYFPALIEQFEKELDRPLTEEESALVRKAYKMGRKKAFDIPMTKKKKGEKKPAAQPKP